MYWKTYIFIYTFFILLPYVTIANSWGAAYRDKGHYREVSQQEFYSAPRFYVTNTPSGKYLNYQTNNGGGGYYHYSSTAAAQPVYPPSPYAYGVDQASYQQAAPGYYDSKTDTSRPVKRKEEAYDYPLYFDN